MNKDFVLYDTWNEALERQVLTLMTLAEEEDAPDPGDLTSLALIPDGMFGNTYVVSREAGTICGLTAAENIVRLTGNGLEWQTRCPDGTQVNPGQIIAEFSGPVRTLLTTERIILNFIGHMSGVATKTAQYVQEVEGTGVRIYDTRKTLPGWRLLDKYAVAMGGGHNHRLGLYDHILIKDNHIAFSGEAGLTPADAVIRARDWLTKHYSSDNCPLIEIEVDTLEQLALVLPTAPDIVLLDNMGADMLREAVEMRNESGKKTELEASGGVNMNTVRSLAMSGVERISIGALTHSAPCFDVGLDFLD